MIATSTVLCPLFVFLHAINLCDGVTECMNKRMSRRESDTSFGPSIDDDIIGCIIWMLMLVLLRGHRTHGAKMIWVVEEEGTQPTQSWREEKLTQFKFPRVQTCSLHIRLQRSTKILMIVSPFSEWNSQKRASMESRFYEWSSKAGSVNSPQWIKLEARPTWSWTDTLPACLSAPFFS